MLKPKAKPKSSPNTILQRKSFFSKNENENFMSSSKDNGFFSSGNVQTKLMVGKADDSLETEADATADAVVDKIENTKTGDTPSLSRISSTNTQAKTIQAKSAGNTAVDSDVGLPTGSSSNLDSATQSSMEGGFSADFSGVRIHTGSDATAMNQGLNARAFTKGNDIYFNEGQYNTGTTDGKRLLAHELTHTIQQGASPVMEPKEPNVKEDGGKQTEGEVKHVAETKDKVEGERKDEKDKVSEKEKGGDKVAAKGEVKGKSKKGKKKKKLSLMTFLGEPKKEKSGGGGGGGGSAARVTEMSNPSLDGGPERVEQKTVESKGKVTSELNTKSEGVLQQGIEKSKALSTAEKEKEDSGTKLKNVEASVEIKPEEKQSEVNNKQVAKVDAVKPPEVKEDKAQEELKDKIEESMPDSLKEAMKYASNGKGKKIGQAVGSIVENDVEAVESTYQEVENTEAPEAPPPSEPLNEIEPVQDTPAMELGEGLVPPTSEKQSDLSEYDKESDNLLEKEGIPEEQLEMVDSGDLAEAKQHRKDIKKKKSSEPAKIKAFEQAKRIETKVALQKEEKKTKDTMRSKRQKELEGSKNEQQKAKTALEKKREAVTKKINTIYETANTSVKEKLKNLKADSLKAFDKEEKKSSKEFEDNVKSRLNAFKRRRYGGRWGGAKWLKDKLLGMDDLPEVKEIFDTEKKTFENKIDAAIKAITKANKKVIKECKDIVAQAKKDIATYVKGLGPALKKTGLEAQKKMKEKLDQLDKDVNKAEKDLNNKLKEKREAAVKAIEKKIEKMKEEMSGLVGKLGKLLLDALLKFFKWALEKIGASSDQLMGKINKGKSVITKIVKDPKGFFRNLGTAVGNGIKNFRKNIKSWLIKGLISWLTGAMGDSGLVLPQKFDLKGIFGLGLQVMGLSWTFIRSRLVKRIPEQVVAAAETGFDIIKRVIKDGPIAIWQMIKEKAAEVKKSIMEGIRNWIIAQVVKKATVKLLSMLNPAGAIVQAIIAIYDLVMFFVDNWDRIVQFVKSVFNSISDIAFGNLGKAAKLVENALGMTIPIILSFLARFLGLSGIGKAIKNVIAKVRQPVVTAIDKAAIFLSKKLKKWFGNKKGKTEKNQSKATIAKITKGLKDIPKEEKKYLTSGKITKVEAVKVAQAIKRKHPVFKSFTVIDGGKDWNYRYTASPAKTAKGKPKDPLVIPEGNFVKNFSMKGVAHHLTGRSRKGKLTISMASALDLELNAALSNALSELSAMPKFMGKRRIRRRLIAAQGKVSDHMLGQLMDKWGNDGGRLSFPDYVTTYLHKVIASITDLADGTHGLTSLQNLFKQLNRNTTNPGPYAYMTDDPDTAPGKEFSSTQRNAILSANKSRNGGVIKSDLSPHVVLDDSLSAEDDLKPNIDHIKPKSLGGSNSYSNAQVLSRAENQAKGAS